MVEKFNKFISTRPFIGLGILIATFLVLVFMGNKLYTMREIVLTTKTRIADLDMDIKHLDQIEDDKLKTQDKVEKIFLTLPQSYSQIAFFAQQLEEIADSQGEKLEVTIDKTKKDEKEVSSLKFVVKTEGSYQSVKNTLNLLSELPYSTTIDSLKTEKEGGDLINTMTFRIYMKKNE